MAGGRWRRRWHTARPVVVLITVAVIGLLLFHLGWWRVGSAWWGTAAVVAAVLRARLPARRVGVLRVRSRAFDVAFLATVAVMLLTVAVVSVNPHA